MRFNPVQVLVLALAVSGCAVGPNFKKPDAPTTPGYAMPGDDDASARVRLAPSADAPAEWWNAFGSPEINATVEHALANNHTLAEADANLQQARVSLLAHDQRIAGATHELAL